MKVGQKSSDTRLPKPPKPPEKPLMPYMRYSRKVWESVKNANPLLKLWEVGKIIGQMWRELPENEKSHFIEEYENDKIQYNDALRMYHNSPAYKSWLLHKEKVEKTMEDSDSMDGIGQGQKERIVKESHNIENRESYILEDNDEDPDEIFTVKHVAAQRFQRNHKFMLDLFSDFKIPELGSIVTESRLNSLKQQVDGLLMHKRKLDDEVEEWAKKHDSKKLKIKVESEEFWSEYNKELEARPVITEKMFSEMVRRARDDIVREEKERDEFIKTRLCSTERKTSISEQSNDSSSKSESNTSMEQVMPQTQFDQNLNQNININSNISIPNPFTASVVNKPQLPESQGSLGPVTTANFPDSHQNVIVPPFMQMSQRSHLNPYENRSQLPNYGYAQQQQQQQQQLQSPINTMSNHPGRYPQQPPQIHSQSTSSQSQNQHSIPSLSSSTHLSRSNMLSPADSISNDLDLKPPKLNKVRDISSPNMEKETHFDAKNSISKDKPEPSFSAPKLSDSQNCSSTVTQYTKPPILPPKNEPDVKSIYHEQSEQSNASIQSPSKKTSSKKRKPSSNKSKTCSNIQPPDLDAMNSSGQMTQESVGSSALMNPSHVNPGAKMDSGYPADPNFSQMPLQQGLYPYHYYPPPFAPHGRNPAQYGSPYQQGFNQQNYYNQIPQPFRQMSAPHPMQGDMPLNQYPMQHKPVPPNQPYSANPYGQVAYGGYGAPQYPGTGQSYSHGSSQQMIDTSQPQVISNKDIPISQSAPMSSHMNVPDDSSKYSGEVPVSCAPNPGFVNPQLGPTMPPSSAGGGYPSQYPGLPYTNPPTSGAHYPGVQGHYFYYPPGGPQSHNANNSGNIPGTNPPDHAFWSHQQSTNYPLEPNPDSQPPKIQD